MIRRSSIARWLLAIVTAVQVLLPATASVADGMLDGIDARGGVRISHVEAHGSSSCARIHPDNCALCRVSGALAAPGKAIVLPECVARLAAQAPEHAHGGSAAIDHGLPPSRAPPHAEPFVERVA